MWEPHRLTDAKDVVAEQERFAQKGRRACEEEGSRFFGRVQSSGGGANELQESLLSLRYLKSALNSNAEARRTKSARCKLRVLY